ncbi:hypothetical protein GCM10011391_37090 [Pullulanibacillus camelliae]|uniref:Glycosyl transferase family 1 domain-containing protein n=1 Tax=Pullulanibacillus camelliae TaxID=1707096 RepID=A0A8J2YNM8_9BACL|nr:glycosyltransferase [Pullulanibacillus camelliae]GGE54720.1 hypothetical protein GCM10011391_37090 [Pullulanibacillus camelliae]
MKKKVCMFVWNHFTNDARVLRECTALSHNGFEVDLIAIHDRKDPTLPRYEKHDAGFSIIRVKNFFPGIQRLLGLVKHYKRNGMISIPITAIGIYFLCLGIRFLPLWMSLTLLALLVVMALLFLTKLPKYTVRLFIFLQMVRWGMKKRYDIYHANDLNTLPQGWLCAKILRLRKKPLIYDSHEVQTSRTGYDSPLYGLLEWFYLKFTDTMIMENHTRAKYVEERYGFYPKVVHNYPVTRYPEQDTSILLAKQLHLSNDEPILLYQGGIQTGRGLEQLLEAFPNFKRGHLVFIGDGRIKDMLIKKVEDMGLTDRIHFLPKVPVEDLLLYTKNAYLGFQVLNNVCFNHYSASSNKLFEYMMSGVPVVACSFPEIKKVVDEENIGVCVNSHDPLSIAEGVNRLLEDKECYQRMRQNCFKARDKYNWEHEQVHFLAIYEELIDVNSKKSIISSKEVRNKSFLSQK